MSARLETESDRGTPRDESSVVVHAAKWVCLAATPVFALMALLTALVAPDVPHVHSSMGHGGSALSGMVPMYLLMSIFHSAPWLRRIAGRRSNSRES